jgi:hypothetical protein
MEKNANRFFYIPGRVYILILLKHYDRRGHETVVR